MTNGSLSGIRVLDLSRVLAGPYCGQMLADHGAEVIKVEPPEGDMTRQWGPPFKDGVSAYYSGLNRNKEVITLNLATDEGQGIVRSLIAKSDVVIENFKSGTMDRWGLSYDALSADNPKLIYCRITGFGYGGPMGGLPGYDAVLQAYSGIMGVNGSSDSGPLKVAMPIVDLTTGMLAFGGVSAALVERSRSGLGQIVDLSLLDSAISLLHPVAANYFMSGDEPARIGNGHPNVAPYETFYDADGNGLFVGGGNDRQFRALCAFLGDESLADDERFATNADRLANRVELSDLIAKLMSRVDLKDASDQMIRSGVPASRIASLSEALDDPQVLHRQMRVRSDGYEGLGIPIKFVRTPGGVRTVPKRQSSDTVKVLERMGYSSEDIDKLSASGVIGVATQEFIESESN